VIDDHARNDRMCTHQRCRGSSSRGKQGLDCCQHCCQGHDQLPTRDDGSGTSAQTTAAHGRSWTVHPCLRIKRSGACRRKCGCPPRTRRRSVHDSRNLSRAPAASLCDRLRRPLTEPVCRQVRQQSGSGEGSGQGRTRSQRRGDLGDGAQDQRLTATVTATTSATG
jgi:hypothetical protein